MPEPSPEPSAGTDAQPAPPLQVRRPARSRFSMLRGLRQHWLEWPAEGPAHAHRPTLVMLHGWMDVAASFQFVVDSLQPGVRVVALDWRGFGHSHSGADTFWFPDYLGDLDAWLAEVSPDAPADLLGHSMGGNVAMIYAGVRPARVRRLVNLEGFGMPATRPEQAPERLSRWLDELRNPARMRHYASLEAVADWLRQNNPRLRTDRALWLAGRWSEARTDEQGRTRWHILGEAAHKHVNPTLYRVEEVLATWARIEAPTLWVDGDLTDMGQWWGSRYLRHEFEVRLAVVRQVERHRLAPAGHMLHHDQPEALAALIDTFLDR